MTSSPAGPISCFLPCRLGSQRVPHKNIRPFADHPFGLVEIKLRQRLACPLIHRIVLSTNDAAILDYAASLPAERLTIHRRTDALASSATSTDALIAHALELIPDGHILWTHVTSPFVSADHYRRLIEAYLAALEAGFDSLVSATTLRSFLWSEQGPLNYNRDQEKWPRTQTLAPVHDINSACFLAPARLYRERGDRLGERPCFFELDRLASLDIDWPDDFTFAERLLAAGIAST